MHPRRLRRLILRFRLGIVFWPAGLEIGFENVLVAVFRRFIENLALQGVGHKFHIGKMTGVVVGILVPVTVPKLRSP